MRRLAALSTLLFTFLATSLIAQVPGPPVNNPPGWVVIPHKDYDALRAKIAPPEFEPEPPAFDATLTRVDYDLSLKDTQVSGRVTLVVDVLNDGWAQVPLPSGFIVGDAHLPPSCRLIEGALAFTKKGRFVVQLDAAIPVSLAGGEQQIKLSANTSGVTRASFRLGRAGMDMTASGGILSEAAGDPWVAYANGGEPLVLSWRRKVEEHREELPLKQSGTLVQLWSLGEDSSALTAEVTVDVTQGAARQIALDLPAGITINHVLGANVSDWTPTGGILTVSFLEPVDGQAKFLIQGEAKLPREGSLDC